MMLLSTSISSGLKSTGVAAFLGGESSDGVITWVVFYLLMDSMMSSSWGHSCACPELDSSRSGNYPVFCKLCFMGFISETSMEFKIWILGSMLDREILDDISLFLSV